MAVVLQGTRVSSSDAARAGAEAGREREREREQERERERVSRTWRDRLLGAGTGATLTHVTLWFVLVSAAAAGAILRA